MKEIHEAIHQFPEIFKTPFMLYFEGYKYHEIAEIIERTLGNNQKQDPFCPKIVERTNQQILNFRYGQQSVNVIVIGSGFAGLSAASFMAKAGWNVTVIEKNQYPGGRARQLKEDGFYFDMGPSCTGCLMYLKDILNSLEKK